MTSPPQRAFEWLRDPQGRVRVWLEDAGQANGRHWTRAWPRTPSGARAIGGVVSDAGPAYAFWYAHNALRAHVVPGDLHAALWLAQDVRESCRFAQARLGRARAREEASFLTGIIAEALGEEPPLLKLLCQEVQL